MAPKFVLQICKFAQHLLPPPKDWTEGKIKAQTEVQYSKQYVT